MYYVNEEYNLETFSTKAFDAYFGGLRWGVLDIETSGINPAYARFILGGLLTVHEDHQTFEQYFADTPADEEWALTRFIEACSALDVVVTYNGRMFDIPFTARRAARYGLKLPDSLYDLDVYRAIGYGSNLGDLLPNLKQKTVESFMGLADLRTDEISGGESVELYSAYLRNPSVALRDTILLHNADDVKQLYRLMPVLSRTDLHLALGRLGIPVGFGRASSGALACDRPAVVIKAMRLGKKQLSISGKQIENAADYACFPQPGAEIEAQFRSDTADFMVRVPLIRQKNPDGTEIAIADLRAIGCEPGEDFGGKASDIIADSPMYSDGLLLLRNGKTTRYAELNALAAALIEHILATL